MNARATVDGRRRQASTGVQLARMRYRHSPLLCFDTLSENAREIYELARVRCGLPAPVD